MLLGRLKGKAIMSPNDHPDIRRIFAAFEMDTVTIPYTVGGGDKVVERSEVIYLKLGPFKGSSWAVLICPPRRPVEPDRT
jgi:hypothetical protein